MPRNYWAQAHDEDPAGCNEDPTQPKKRLIHKSPVLKQVKGNVMCLVGMAEYTASHSEDTSSKCLGQSIDSRECLGQ